MRPAWSLPSRPTTKSPNRLRSSLTTPAASSFACAELAPRDVIRTVTMPDEAVVPTVGLAPLAITVGNLSANARLAPFQTYALRYELWRRFHPAGEAGRAR